MSHPHPSDDLPLFSFAVVKRPGDPTVDLIMLGCLTCGASVYEIEHQTGDLCPMCSKEPEQCP